ncbi:unnamed protein product [Lactuca saligna]|uniref:Uncharacterized protein n=1 Tax=Lactuca saligna TaxID=75948 RepID=A0AA36E544_LACSI|nr:unnamed protein product [Lactuca saligna]CAI9281921.1 unnamed protein product [Lactuca saligna]
MNSVLINYMTIVDPKFQTGKLLTKEGAGPSKNSRTTKKTEIIIPEPNVKEMKTSKSPKTKVDEVVSKTVIKLVQHVVTEPTSVTIPSKTRVSCRLKLKYGGSPTSNVVHSEMRNLERVDHPDQTTELRINSFNSKYVGAVIELTNIQKERHTLLVMDVKKVREDVYLKL